jgi:Leucine-rich repeat (LRR) protein
MKETDKERAMDKALMLIKECKKKHSHYLEIGYNGYLDKFPEEIRELTWLTSLSVVCTEISRIPDWIGGFVNLRFLDLHSN